MLISVSCFFLLFFPLLILNVFLIILLTIPYKTILHKTIKIVATIYFIKILSKISSIYIYPLISIISKIRFKSAVLVKPISIFLSFIFTFESYFSRNKFSTYL